MRWTLLRCFFLIASFRCRSTYSWGWVFSSWLFTLNLQARSISFFFFCFWLPPFSFLFVWGHGGLSICFFFFTEFCFVISAVHSFLIDGANMRFSPTFEQRREEGWYCLSLPVFFFYVSTSKRPLSDCGILFSFFQFFFVCFFVLSVFCEIEDNNFVWKLFTAFFF